MKVWCDVRAGRGCRGVCVGVLAVAALLGGGCGGRYQVRVTNETEKTLFVGIVESGPGVNKVHERATIGVGERADLSAWREGDERSKVSLMVGDSPNPRDRAVMRTLEKGKNRYVAKPLSPGAPGSGMTLERDEGWW